MENHDFKFQADKKVWFSMWFLGGVVSFGIAFFLMFYRLVEGRNKHFANEEQLDERVADYQKHKGKELHETIQHIKPMKAKLWASSIVLIVPIWIILYLLSRDLLAHEKKQDDFLAAAFPKRMFMPQTIPIKTYVILTIITLGIGGVYWLYKVTNLYNAHYKADLQVQKEIVHQTEEEAVVEHM